jgi:hypothetical protein
MIKPAIVIVGYNRPDAINRLLNSISKARYETNGIPLIISIDESNKSNQIEDIARNFHWEYGIKEIRRFPQRQGLRKHIIQCGDLSEKFGAVIVLEDDLAVAEDFYTYVCKTHDFYSDDEKICGVSLYSYNATPFTHFTFSPMPTIFDVYLGDMIVTWGQSWTYKQWNKFKKWYEEHVDKLPAENPKIPMDISGWTRSWGRYFASYMADLELSYIYPYIARSTCYSDFGEHNKNHVPFTFVQVPLMNGYKYEYNFAKYEKLVHYDSFFERKLSNKDVIHGIPGDNIVMDLNNMKTSMEGKDYVITNSKLPYKIITSFGLTLRPISMNVLNEVPGNQINLYFVEKGVSIRFLNVNHPRYKANLYRLKYEFRDVSWRILLKYAPAELFSRMKDFIMPLFRKRR